MTAVLGIAVQEKIENMASGKIGQLLKTKHVKPHVKKHAEAKICYNSA